MIFYCYKSLSYLRKGHKLTGFISEAMNALLHIAYEQNDVENVHITYRRRNNNAEENIVVLTNCRQNNVECVSAILKKENMDIC